MSQMRIYSRNEWDVTDLIEADPSASPPAPKRVEIRFDWEGDPVITVYTRCQAHNGTPPAYWHGLGRTATLATVDAQALDALLASDAVATRVKTVQEGYERVWNGNNHVGRYTAEAEAAWAEIAGEIEELDGDLPDGVGLWEVDEWLHDEARERIDADTTDEELAALAAQYEAEAESQGVVLAGDAGDFLRECRDCAREATDGE